MSSKHGLQGNDRGMRPQHGGVHGRAGQGVKSHGHGMESGRGHHRELWWGGEWGRGSWRADLSPHGQAADWKDLVAEEWGLGGQKGGVVLEDGVTDGDGAGGHGRGQVVDWVEHGGRGHGHMRTRVDRLHLARKHLLVEYMSVGLDLQQAVLLHTIRGWLETLSVVGASWSVVGARWLVVRSWDQVLTDPPLILVPDPWVTSWTLAQGTVLTRFV